MLAGLPNAWSLPRNSSVSSVQFNPVQQNKNAAKSPPEPKGSKALDGSQQMPAPDYDPRPTMDGQPFADNAAFPTHPDQPANFETGLNHLPEHARITGNDDIIATFFQNGGQNCHLRCALHKRGAGCKTRLEFKNLTF